MARLTPLLRKLVVHRIAEADWRLVARGIAVADVLATVPAWRGQTRRFVCLRLTLAEHPDAQGRRLIECPGYTYRVLVTTVPSAKGSVVQGYNCQAAVDATAQIIVAADGTDEANDKQQAQPMLPQVLVNTEQVPRTVSMAAGYFSEANITPLTTLGWMLLIPPDRQRHGQVVPAVPRGRPPAGLSVADRMRRTLRTKQGRWLYAQRKAIVEPVFGQIKPGRGYRQFLLRGMRQVRGESAVICTPHNMLKLWRALRQRHHRPSAGLRALSRNQRRARRA